MVDPAIPQDRAPASRLRLGLSLWRALLARHGSRLLAVELILTLAGVVLVLPWLLLSVTDVRDGATAAVTVTLSSVMAAFFTAWSWVAALTILAQDPSGDALRVTAWEALRAGLRGDGLRGLLRLWGRLVVLLVFTLPSLLIYFDFDLATSAALGTAMSVVSWYVGFATALLPMAVLLERRGIRRAWLLAHGGLGTAAGIVAVLAVESGVEWLLDEFVPRGAETVVSVVLGVPLAVLTTVAYYAIYLVHIMPRAGAPAAVP